MDGAYAADLLVSGNNACVAWLQSQNPYGNSVGLDQLLDWARLFLAASDYYYYKAIVCPPSAESLFVPRETKEFTVSVETGAYPLYITAGGDWPVPGPDPHIDFRLNIFDKGSGTPIFSKTFGQSMALGQRSRLDLPRTTPIGPYWLATPFPLAAPGQLQIHLTNMADTVAGHIQVLVACAIPFNIGSINKVGAV